MIYRLVANIWVEIIFVKKPSINRIPNESGRGLQLITFLSLIFPTLYASMHVYVSECMWVSISHRCKKPRPFLQDTTQKSLYIYRVRPLAAKWKITISILAPSSSTSSSRCHTRVCFCFFFSCSSGVVVLLRPTMMIKRKTKHSRWLFFQPTPMHKHLQSKWLASTSMAVVYCCCCWSDGCSPKERKNKNVIVRCENCRVIISRSSRRLRRPLLVIKVGFYASIIFPSNSCAAAVFVRSRLEIYFSIFFEFANVRRYFHIIAVWLSEEREKDMRWRRRWWQRWCRWLLDCTLSLVSFVSCTGFYGRTEVILCTTRILVFRHAKVNCALQPKLEWVIEVKLCTWMTRVCTQSGCEICQNCTRAQTIIKGKKQKNETLAPRTQHLQVYAAHLISRCQRKQSLQISISM